MFHFNLTSRIIILLSASLILSFFSWGRRLLFPFQIFTTWVHESWHALIAGLAGAEAIQITLAADGSGLTTYKLPRGKIQQGLIASAGYLGASATGCLIFYFTVRATELHPPLSLQTVLLFMSSLISLTLLFWIRNLFGFFSVLMMGGLIAALYFSPFNSYAQEALLFLGIQTALNALFDIRTLFGFSSKRGSTDAHQMQKLFYFPHWFWALAWLLLSLLMLLFTVQWIWHFKIF